MNLEDRIIVQRGKRRLIQVRQRELIKKSSDRTSLQLASQVYNRPIKTVRAFRKANKTKPSAAIKNSFNNIVINYSAQGSQHSNTILRLKSSSTIDIHDDRRQGSRMQVKSSGKSNKSYLIKDRSRSKISQLRQINSNRRDSNFLQQMKQALRKLQYRVNRLSPEPRTVDLNQVALNMLNRLFRRRVRSAWNILCR